MKINTKIIVIIFLIFLTIFIVISVIKPNQTQTLPTPLDSTSPINKFSFDPIETPETNQQPADDAQFGKIINGLHQKYPWYSSIPIETKDFRIIYDFNKKAFRIRLLTQPSNEKQQQAIQSIKNIGADLNEFSVYFIKD